MCGTDYCAGCKPTEYMLAYGRGEVHVRPEFGDGAQAWVTTENRWKVLRKLVAEDDPRANDFPEVVLHGKYASWLNHTIRRVRAIFFELEPRVPTLGEYMETRCKAFNPGAFGGAKHKRKKAARRYRERVIRDFVVENGGMQMLKRLSDLVDQHRYGRLNSPKPQLPKSLTAILDKPANEARTRKLVCA